MTEWTEYIDDLGRVVRLLVDSDDSKPRGPGFNPGQANYFYRTVPHVITQVVDSNSVIINRNKQPHSLTGAGAFNKHRCRIHFVDWGRTCYPRSNTRLE